MDILEFLEGVKLGDFSLATILSAVIVFLVCYIAIRILKRVVANVLNKTRLEKGLKNFINSLLTVGLWAIAVIIVADTLGIPTASLVALLSVAGLALSLSVQNLMTNLFSGATVLVTKPFVSGDFVEMGGVSGTVESIGLFHTEIVSGDRRRIFVPNSEVTASRIINYSKEPLRRVDLVFSAGYDCPTQTVRDALRDAANSVEQVLETPETEIYLSAYGDSNIEYTLRAWVRNEDYWTAYFALQETVREKYGEYGVSMSYPQIKISQ